MRVVIMWTLQCVSVDSLLHDPKSFGSQLLDTEYRSVGLFFQWSNLTLKWAHLPMTHKHENWQFALTDGQTPHWLADELPAILVTLRQAVYEIWIIC